MKKTGLIVIAVCTMCFSAFAQKGFYLSASAGGGIGGSTFKDYGSTITKSTIPGYKAQLTAGYQLNKFRFQTGLQYSISGYKLKGLLFSDIDPALNPVMSNGTYKITFAHVGIPVQVGYVFRSEKKLKIVPSIGLLTTYNLGATSELKSGFGERRDKWGKETYDMSYNRISVWAIAGVQLEYALNNRISIIGGPDFQFGLSRFDKGLSIGESAAQHNYTAHINLGAKVNL